MEFRSLLEAFILIFALVVAPAASRAQSKKDDRAITIKQPNAVKELPNKGKRFALVIGVDQYADTQITTLGGASNDARSLAEALTQYAGFPSEQVTLLASDQPAERQPTRGNILRRLSNLAAIAPPDGLLLISFSGHGIERGGEAFLLPSDAQVSNDVDLLEQTAINVTQIKDKVSKIGVGQVLVFLDACRNDPSGRSSVDNPLTPAYTRGFNFDLRNREVKAFATLYATEVGHRAYEYKEKKQGYFTWALIEALKGGASNERKEVTLGGLVRYLQERVPRRVLQDLGPGKEQKPFAVIEGYKADELVIAVANAKQIIDANPKSIDRSLGGDKTESKPRVEAQGASLEGTTWTGRSVEAGQFTIQFLKDGKYTYTISTGSTHGTWKQVGNYVQMAMNNGYSVMDATLDGDLMKVDGKNQEGTKWSWILTRKAQ
jgi:caspase domain-containing protein